MIVVRFFISRSSAYCTTCSDSIRISGFLRTARAMATLCFCPPESCTPRSPTLFERCFRRLMRQSAPALARRDQCAVEATFVNSSLTSDFTTVFQSRTSNTDAAI
uniref:Uncharacterized protein n=1 Tax=Kalanchoe fedtschenkoi TaxID=63787 RepID=A0A7N0TDU0_KALFE